MNIPQWLRKSSDEFVMPLPRRTVALNAEQLREDEERTEQREAYWRGQLGLTGLNDAASSWLRECMNWVPWV